MPGDAGESGRSVGLAGGTAPVVVLGRGEIHSQAPPGEGASHWRQRSPEDEAAGSSRSRCWAGEVNKRAAVIGQRTTTAFVRAALRGEGHYA